jgi:hypothetical protein
VTTPARFLVSTLVVLASTTGVVRAASPGTVVAKKHVGFAKLATQAGVRFSREFQALGAELALHDCQLRDSTVASLPPDRVSLARAYAVDYCQPWTKLWDDVLDQCDGEKPPAWCEVESEVLTHLDLDRYFDTVTAALDAATSALERENIMDLALDPFAAHVITEFESAAPDRWATHALDVYLKHASPEQAIAVAKSLADSWVGITPGVASLFHDFLKLNGHFTTEQRQELEQLIAKGSAGNGG